MPLYFAYGSNMDAGQMAQRCPASRALGLARLPRHRFVIMREGYASVLRDPRRHVLGLVWDLALADVPALDRYEGVSGGLYAKAIQPVLTSQGSRRALIYLGRNAGPGQPKSGYLEAVIEAGRVAGLPAPYLREIAACSQRPASGAGSRAITPTRRTPHDPVASTTPAGWTWTP